MRTEKATEARFVEPRVNIYEEPERIVLQAELPGVSRDNLDIDIDGDRLTITGRRFPEAEGVRMVYGERCPFGFRRTFILGNAIDREKVNATLKDGVLELVLGKVAKPKARKIEIKAG